MDKLERAQYLMDAYRRNGRTVKDALGSACIQIADYEERIDELTRELSGVIEQSKELRIENEFLKIKWQTEHDELVRIRERLVRSETMFNQFVNHERENDDG